MTDPAASGGPLDPADFARLVAEASDEQLAAGMAANRDFILAEVFRQMPARFDGAAAGDLSAVVEWRVLDRPDGGDDRFHLVIEDGTCRLDPEASRQPTVSYSIGPVEFLRLLADPARGPEYFMFGKLRVDGDVVLAARMPAMFRPPVAGA